MTVAMRPPCDEAVILAGSPAVPCDRRLGPWILAATILGSSMVFIDGTVVNVALPALQVALGATAADALWIVESYALLLAALLLVGGALGDRYGRRRVFTIGVALFAAASVWCGLAVDLGQLIVARAAQGVGGALLVPGSLAIISASFSEAERGKAIGTWSGFTAVTAALGPVLGGWLVENASWRWVFYINIPIALIVLAIVLTRVPESRDESSGGPPDLLGALLATAGLGGLVFGLIEAGALGLGHPKVLIALAIGATSLGGFIMVEARVASPMMPLSLFRSRTFAGANLLTFLLYSAWHTLLLALQPHPGSGIHGDRRRRGLPAVDRSDVRALALGWWSRCEIWQPSPADRRAERGCNRLRDDGVAWCRRQLLDDFFSGHRRNGDRHVDQRCAAHDSGHGCDRCSARRSRVRRKQRRFESGWPNSRRSARAHHDRVVWACT